MVARTRDPGTPLLGGVFYCMKKKNLWFVTGGVLILLVMISAIVFLRAHTAMKELRPVALPASTSQVTESAPQAPSVTPTISLTAGTVNVSLSIHTGDTLYDAMVRAQHAGMLTFSGKEYSGLGFFVTSVGSLTQAGGKYPMYFVNGVEASVGVSTYVPKSGDTIIWKLK